MKYGAVIACSGSSPLARGTPPGAPSTGLTRRFIPARAGNTSTPRRRRSADTVHPRSRGEHVLPACRLHIPIGSSPLARGTRCCMNPSRGRGRFIPARAGNTVGPASSKRGPAVHPRSRGEHGPPPPRAPLHLGSSPLARGTRASSSRSNRLDSVHPRSRGEHQSSKSLIQPRSGSSPLARGTHVAEGASCLLPRFIPARAGNTLPCGPGVPATGGSSPLARGTRHRGVHVPVPPRFIPARAGNTGPNPPPASGAPVHPRSRGEHHLALLAGRGSTGSSPLARGTLPQRTIEPAVARFIPARAGNTPRRCGTSRRSSVHPRSRGEHLAGGSAPMRCCGSSPLARGTPAPVSCYCGD